MLFYAPITDDLNRYIAYYCSNYTSKDEATTMNLLEFFSRKLRELQMYNPGTANDGQKAYSSVLFSTIHKFAACNEVGGVEASSTLLGYSDHYTNSVFRPINWKGWDIWLVKHLQPDYKYHSYTKLNVTNDTYFSVLQNSMIEPGLSDSIDSHFSLQDFKDGYLNRSSKLENVSLFQMVIEYTLTPYEKGMEDFLPLSRISEYDTSQKTWGHLRKVVNMIPTLPWFNATSKQHGVGTEAFARLMVILFKPFRSAIDLKPATTYELMYKEWKKELDLNESPYMYMINLEKNGRTGWEANTDEAKAATKDSFPNHPEHTSQETNDGKEKGKKIRVAFHLPPLISSRNFMPPGAVTSIVKTLQQTNAAFGDRLARSRQLTTNITDEYENYDELVWSFLNSERTSKTCDVQWNCLKLVGKHFIDTLKKEKPPPLRLLVLGEGGTGKSFIIDTITKMFDRLNRTNDYVVCAPTGKAAINVNGDTIDGVFRFSRNLNNKESCLPQNAPVMLAKYLLVDEISMVVSQL
jgi:hypothetical protein